MGVPAPAARPRRTAAFGFIFASALMNSISFGLMIPILPNLIKQFTGGDTAQADVLEKIGAGAKAHPRRTAGKEPGGIVARRPVPDLAPFGTFQIVICKHGYPREEDLPALTTP